MKKKQRENNLGKILKCQEMERKAGIKEIYYITRSFLVRRAQDIRRRRKIFVKMISRKIENWRNYKGARERAKRWGSFTEKKEIFVFLLCFDKSFCFIKDQKSVPLRKNIHTLQFQLPRISLNKWHKEKIVFLFIYPE